MYGIYRLQWPRNSPCSRSRMENLRPFLNVKSVPVISNLVSNLLYDIIEVTKSKILSLRLQTGRMAKKNAALNSPCSRSRMKYLRPLLRASSVPVISNLV